MSLKTLTPAVELIASHQPHLTCVLESVWMHALHRKPGGIKRRGISLDDWVTGTDGSTVLCIALQVWGQSRSLVTSSMEHAMKHVCCTNSGPSREGPRRSPLLPVQIQWKYLLRTNHHDDIERFLLLSVAELLPDPLFWCSSFGSCVKISQEQVATSCVSDFTINLSQWFHQFCLALVVCKLLQGCLLPNTLR